MIPNATLIGRSLRVVRRELRLRQVDLAEQVGVSQTFVSRVERGILAGVPVEELVALFGAVGARLELKPWWNGAALDRLLDTKHAALTEFVVGVLVACGWEARVEVSFSVYGERGSFDIVGWHPGTRTLLIVEIKTEFGSMEATLRTFDVKLRLARRVVQERFGWAATSVATLLVLQDDRRNRRHARNHASSLGPLAPTSGWHVRGWLREPIGEFSALWFASPSRGTTPTRGSVDPGRVRRASAAVAERETPVGEVPRRGPTPETAG